MLDQGLDYLNLHKALYASSMLYYKIYMELDSHNIRISSYDIETIYILSLLVRSVMD